MKTLNILFFSAVLLLCSCGKTDMEKLQWIQGVWVDEYEEVSQVERWNWAGKIISGKGIEVIGGDSNVKEEMTILERNGNLLFIADVPENDMLIEFPLKSIEGQKVVFENLKHDWPKQIVYELSGDSLIATAGVGEGEEGKSVSLVYRRVDL